MRAPPLASAAGREKGWGWGSALPITAGQDGPSCGLLACWAGWRKIGCVHVTSVCSVIRFGLP